MYVYMGKLRKNENNTEISLYQDDQLEPIYKSSLDTGYSLEDLPGAMDDRDGWREKV